MIIVTGATGQLGRQIVEALVKRVPAGRVGVSVRDPSKAEDLKALGVRVRLGDFAKPATLAHAFEGASQVLLVSSNALSYGGDTLAQHRAAIEAARAAGAERVVYTSHAGASATSTFAPCRDHAATEELLRASGMRWTSLRNGFYATTALREIEAARKTGALSTPADGKVAWTAHRDLAEAAAAVLVEAGRFEGPTPPLTGSEALSYDDVALMAGDVLRMPLRREVLSDDAWKARLIAQGLPPHVAAFALTVFTAARAGEFARVDGTLEQLIGRRPTTLRELLATSS